MSKHKIRYILPPLAVIVSAARVGATEPSGKTANALKPQKGKNLCPEPVGQMDEDCLRLTLLDFEIALDKKYEDLFRRATAEDQKLHGLTKQCFTSIRPKRKAYKEELCSDPTVTTDLKTPLGKILYLCDIQQAQYHLKALEHFQFF